jgi:hypothetical protein
MEIVDDFGGKSCLPGASGITGDKERVKAERNRGRRLGSAIPTA